MINDYERKRTGVLFLFMLCACLSAAAALSLPRTAQAGNSMLAIDVNPDRNTPSSVGKIETCAEHDVGEQFAVDVIVNNVTDLHAWELRVDFDPDVVDLKAAEYGYFLLTAGNTGSVTFTLFERESAGRYFLAAVDHTGKPDSGSGILARLTVEAVGEGRSPIRIVSSPPYLAPFLRTPDDIVLGDSDGDRHWDDTVVGGEVRVGLSCQDSPVVTPKPSPRPTPAPGATGGPTPEPGAGPDDVGGDDDPLVANPSEGGNEGAANDPDAAPGPGPDGIHGTEDDEPAPAPGDDSAGEAESDAPPGSRSADTGGFSATLVLLGIAGVAAGLTAAGGGLYALSKRERL